MKKDLMIRNSTAEFLIFHVQSKELAENSTIRKFRIVQKEDIAMVG